MVSTKNSFPWLVDAKKDLMWIIGPPFYILLLVVFFHENFSVWQAQYSFLTWLILIVFIDVAHVYATLFKTYFNREELRQHPWRYYGIPVLAFLLGIMLHKAGSGVFWTALALVAVFHFIRQQYGFMRLYSRMEAESWRKKIDAAVVYLACGYPMTYWFSHPRKFTWFVEGEFSWLPHVPHLSFTIGVLYALAAVIYVLKTVDDWYRYGYFNLPKNLLLLGTALSWYLGIVYFNNDFIFTLFNVVSHGIPYMALIYFTTDTPPSTRRAVSGRNSGLRRFLFFVCLLLVLAFGEELIWETTVWQEHVKGITVPLQTGFHWWLVPLLSVPQFTHYLLDGFIWKRKKHA